MQYKINIYDRNYQKYDFNNNIDISNVLFNPINSRYLLIPKLPLLQPSVTFTCIYPVLY